MSHFTPDSQKRRKNRLKRQAEIRMKLNAEQRRFEANASKPYRILNTTFLTLKIQPYKANHVKSFMVMLDKPLLKSELMARMEMAFGDLPC